MPVIQRSDKAKLLLIADDSLLGQSLATLFVRNFDCFVVDEKYSVPIQIDSIKPLHTIFALDLNKPKNVKLLSELLGRGSHTTSIFAAKLTPAVQVKLILAGVRGVLDVGMRPDVLVRAVQKMCDGEVWISRQITAQLLAHIPKRGQALSTAGDAALIKRLTPRQVQIAKVCASNLGASNRALATKLQLSDASLRNALSAIFDTLGMKNRNELFLFLQRNSEALPSTNL
jgi:DNA-binding NarL/FixJ family response regulator